MSVSITRLSDCIELTVIAQSLASPAVYAYTPSDPIADFCQQLAIDLGEPGAPGIVTAASGAVMSPTMSHSFAWRPGRVVTVGSVRLSVSIVVVPAPGQDDAQPGGRGIHCSVGKPCMKYIVVTGGVVSGLGKGVTASSLGVLMKVDCGPILLLAGSPHALLCLRRPVSESPHSKLTHISTLMPAPCLPSSMAKCLHLMMAERCFRMPVPACL